MNIQVEQLEKSFGDQPVLRGVDFTISSGSVVGYLGANGSGKTTTLRILLGLLRPDRGRVRVGPWVAGVDSRSINREVGVVLEVFGLYRHLSVRENLQFFGELRRIERAELRRRIDELLERFDLMSASEKPASSLSKGMSQKLVLARALIHRPGLLILDEPTEGLDPMARRAVKDHVAQLAREEGCTVLLTSHNLAEVQEVCQRLLFLKDGRVVREGETEQLLRSETRLRVRVGFDSQIEAERARGALSGAICVTGVEISGRDLLLDVQEQDARAVGKRLREAGIPYLTLGEERASLEDVYRGVMARAN